MRILSAIILGLLLFGCSARKISVSVKVVTNDATWIACSSDLKAEGKDMKLGQKKLTPPFAILKQSGTCKRGHITPVTPPLPKAGEKKP